MKEILTKLFILLFVNFLTAQKENNIWYFGVHAGLDFNFGTPVPLNDGKIYTNEGCASIANANGELLFYTDGVTVYNMDHEIMPNGDSLGGSFTTSQSAIIVPMPGNKSKYYIFTPGSGDGTKKFTYSIVDMTLNNGKGDVILKNFFLITPVSERLSAIKHINNSDYWVMVHHNTNNSFYAFHVSSSGVNITPVISKIGSVLTNNNYYVAGCMKFSVDGSKIALVSPEDGYVDLFDFNSSTGIVSNEQHLPLPQFPSGENAYGIEFSYSGKYLYASRGKPYSIIQWDISSGASSIIKASIQQINISSGEIGSLQLGPDKKIYLARHDIPGVINEPDAPAIFCNYKDTSLNLGNAMCTYGLPNIIPSDFKLTSTLENKSQLEFTVFPNPFLNNINFEVQKPHLKNVSYTITDILGNSVISLEENNQESIFNKALDLSYLANGVYFLKVRVDDEIGVKIIIKE